MATFSQILSGSGQRDIGQMTVRVAGLVMAAFMLAVAALFATGGGITFCVVAAALFLGAAIFPWGFGQIVGGLILLVALVVMLQGPGGEVGLSGYGMLRATPLYLLGAVFARPDLITMAARIFRA